MEEIIDRFTINITESGVDIISGEGKSLQFTAGEALMLLTILRNEESTLKQMADEAAPIPIKIK